MCLSPCENVHPFTDAQDQTKEYTVAKRFQWLTIPGTVFLVLMLFTTSFTARASGGGPVTTIKGLHTISLVGSTQFILGADGKTTSVDATPYGVAIAPSGTTGGTLQPGDIVVTNFGASSKGTTLVRFPAAKGPGQLFNTVADPGTSGPVAEAFNSSGNDWVANFSGNNVQIFDASGNVVATITNPLFNHPWGQAFNGGVANPNDGSVAAFFATNASDGTLDRIDIVPSGGSVKFEVYQIGQLPWSSLPAVPVVAPQGMVWVPSWYWAGQNYKDVLFVVDAVKNRIAAYPNSSTRNTTSHKSTFAGITVFQGNPLNTPAGLAVNPINGDLLAVNQSDNNLVEINPASAQVVGVRQLDNVPVNQQTGAGSALFGLTATTDKAGNLVVYFADDNTNTLDKLSV